ncbi:MAG: hypothetical protein AB1411_01170 [Nitrospirota bacterium]
MAEGNSRLTVLTIALYWGGVGLGLTLPWLIHLGHEVYGRNVPLRTALQRFGMELLAPGYNLFLVGVFNAVPFVLLSVFLLFHLGTAPPHGAVTVARRVAGVAGAWLAALGLSLWVHLSLALHPDAQGALAVLFLPFYVFLLMLAGYGCGRLISRLWAH